ncbi:hypothetical protein B5G38_04930 [Gemmiger sp. An87]|nr:hypothetical protein B5G38_04930 [Gemmiger sp. An87]
MKRNHWLLAVALPLLLLAGCGAKEPDPGAEAPTPTPAIQIEEPQTQVLRSTDSHGYYTRSAYYDLETMTVKQWDLKLPDGYQMNGGGPVSDGQALYFVLTRQGESANEALVRMPLESGAVQILYECGEHEQIEVAYTDGGGDYDKRPILLRSGERRCFLVHRWTEEDGNSTWLYVWDPVSGSCEPVKRLGSHLRFWGEYQGRAVLGDSWETEEDLLQLDAETGELTVLLSGKNTEAARLFLRPPLLIRENFVCAGTMSADNPDGKERVYCLDLKTGAVRQLASSDDGYLLVRMQDIWDGMLRVRGSEGYESGQWYVDCATGQKVKGMLADESGTPMHIRAQLGEYYLIDVERGCTTDTVWMNEVGEPVYSRVALQELALIAKEDYWAGRPDYRIFEQEGEQAE